MPDAAEIQMPPARSDPRVGGRTRVLVALQRQAERFQVVERDRATPEAESIP
jgi:hypothetical protein